MNKISIRLDKLNPGQFYACCGLNELASYNDPNVLSQFAPIEKHPRNCWFHLEGSLPHDFLSATLASLRSASPEYHPDYEEGIRPVTLTIDRHGVELDWWLNLFRDKPSVIKCWAGQVTTRKLFDELLRLLPAPSDEQDLFEQATLTKSKFGVDPRSAWNARDCGYSPNEHGKDSATFVAVEVLAAIGLQTFRPKVARNRTARYHLWQTPLPLCLARTAALKPWEGLPNDALALSIGSRGQSYKYFKFAEPWIAKKENS